mgnify:CR=1 FL=1
MSQNRIPLVRKDTDVTPPFPLKYASESIVLTDIVPSDKNQTILMKAYDFMIGAHFPEREIGPCSDNIPTMSIVAISADGSAIIGHRPRRVPITGYLVDGLIPLPPKMRDQWEITKNEGTHIYVTGSDGTPVRFDGTAAEQTFPAWWEPGSLIILDDSNSSVKFWVGDRFIIDSILPTMR